MIRLFFVAGSVISIIGGGLTNCIPLAFGGMCALWFLMAFGRSFGPIDRKDGTTSIL